MVNLFNSERIMGQISNSLDGVIRRMKTKSQEVEKRFPEPNILKNSSKV